MISNIDLVRYCDGFPDPELEPEQHAMKLQSLYTMIWTDKQGSFPIGYILEPVLDKIKDVPEDIRGEMIIDTTSRTVSMFQGPSETERTKTVTATTHYLRVNKAASLLSGWRNELWPIYGRNGELLFSMERAAVGLFGCMRYGVHLTAYVPSPTGDPNEMRIWVPKRSSSKSSFPGMLDNTVAGGLMTDEVPFECVIREADEEASLPEKIVRSLAKETGVIKYVYVTDIRSGGEAGYIYPEVQWVYDLELPAEVIPEPKDGEVESFSLVGVDEIKKFLAQGRFKPNCAVVTVDFFIRHGILTRENEPDFDEIQHRLKRRMPFPGPHQAYE